MKTRKLTCATLLLLAGCFAAAQTVPTFSDADWSSLGSGVTNLVTHAYALGVMGGNVYAGGYGLAKWDGTNWSSLGTGLAGGNDAVYAMAVSGTNLYVAGNFATAGGISATNVAKWNGSAWSPLGSGPTHPEFWALAVSGTNLYAGGLFGKVGGVAASRIAKWDGVTWSALGSGVNGAVAALACSGSNVYVGGYFTTAGTVAANNIAKWDGATWSALGSGLDGVDALAASGSYLYAAGGAYGIYKWDGSTWSTVGGGVNNPVSALALSGSDLYVGGDFTFATNSDGVAVPAWGIAKWDGRSWSALGSGADNGVDALGVGSGSLYAGGGFSTMGNKSAPIVARARAYPPFIAIEPDGGPGYFIRLTGIPGPAYRLVRATALGGPWLSSGPQTASPSGLIQFSDPFPPPGQAFYRVSVQP